MMLRNAALAVALMLVPAFALARATPIPGGANQVSGLSGKIGQTVFNGVLRIKIEELRDANAAETAKVLPNANQKVMVLTVLLNNGSHATFTDALRYTLADKDQVAVQIPSSYITHANPDILQGASLRQTAIFPVDKSFVPVKLLVECASCAPSQGFRAVRFTR